MGIDVDQCSHESPHNIAKPDLIDPWCDVFTQALQHRRPFPKIRRCAFEVSRRHSGECSREQDLRQANRRFRGCKIGERARRSGYPYVRS